VQIAITGSSGLVGTELKDLLRRNGHTVLAMVRKPAAASGEIAWDPKTGRLDARSLSGLDAVVNLAGESIASGRWSATRKREILESRTRGTRLLCERLAQASGRPRVLVSASAIGFYGDRGDELLTESSGPGRGFLADVCRAWEESTRPAREAGVRVAHLRTGVVLSAKGGALAKMLTPFRLGVGGVLGDGSQFMSCIALEDLVRAIVHVLTNEGVDGPVNGVGPQAVTNREFTKALGRVLRRPTLLPVPAAVLKLALGEMADELLLASTRVRPAALEAAGFEFVYPTVEDALRAALRSR
jgi:uncharacterized protein (TIGR01777 family)